MLEVEEKSARMFDVLFSLSVVLAWRDHGVLVSVVDALDGVLTALTRARSYFDLRSCGVGSASTMRSSLESSLLRLIEVVSGQAAGVRVLVAMLWTVCIAGDVCGVCWERWEAQQLVFQR